MSLVSHSFQTNVKNYFPAFGFCGGIPWVEPGEIPQRPNAETLLDVCLKNYFPAFGFCGGIPWVEPGETPQRPNAETLLNVCLK